jgi:hypothetical protein
MALAGRKLYVSHNHYQRRELVANLGRCVARVTASITFSGAQLILAAITLWDESYVPTAWQTVLTYWLCLIFSLSINVFFNS